MPGEPNQPPEPAAREGWNVARPEKVPEPTVWPPALALGTTLLLWGLVSSYIITCIGLLLFARALAGWIGEIRHERQSPSLPTPRRAP
jgi:hypothetical protein